METRDKTLRKQHEIRRERIKELMVKGFTAKEMVVLLRAEDLLPSSAKPYTADPEELRLRNDADYRLIRNDIAAVVKAIEKAPERDAVVVAKEAKAMYRARLELTLKRASMDLDSGLAVGPVKAAAYRAFLDAAARLASLDGVITEPKIPVEVGGDAIVKGVLERFVAKQRESQRAEEEGIAA